MIYDAELEVAMGVICTNLAIFPSIAFCIFSLIFCVSNIGPCFSMGAVKLFPMHVLSNICWSINLKLA